MNQKNHPDIIMIYQDRDNIELALEQIMDLKLSFKAFKYSKKELHNIAEMTPKVLLLSSNDVRRTIQLYIDYLEDYEQNIAPHSAVLLINNRESFHAYLACENGLFDNYVIINPLNEPYRLKLVLQQELRVIERHHQNSLTELIAEGEDELASCIEHGVNLKKSFLHEVKECESGLLAATNIDLDKEALKTVLQNIIGVKFDEMNESVSTSIQDIMDQLITLKSNNQSLKDSINDNHAPKKKTVMGFNLNQLIDNNIEEKHDSTLSYKVLIAEPSDLFFQVIEAIFSETVFKYLLVRDGEEALEKIETFNPDVIIMAYDLPKINGIDVTKKLRKNNHNTPIIAYIDRNDKNMLKNWIPLGLSSYLIKPSKKSLILTSIAKALKQPVDIIYHKEDEDIDQIEWSPEYSIGNEDMDEQHKVLFTTINDFFHAKDKQLAIEIFHNLYSYIDLHFKAEEDLLRQINYANTDEHAEHHQELFEKLQLFQEKLPDNFEELHHKTAIFIYQWLSTHILTCDMDYKKYALSIEEESFHNT
ncbi:MAG: bacteriohemerythrin [Litorilituus sp.]|nr:bacteriohemerythrin [Litorilituus sp.]